MNLKQLVATAVTFFVVGIASQSDARSLVAVVSGETHALLEPCNCPIAPNGGLGRRSTAIAAIRDTAEVILLDAGGFAGGGVYDSYTEGRARDSLRTIAVVKGMAALAYDAIGVGDDDLQYGALWLKSVAAAGLVPLVSANIFDARNELLFPAVRYVSKAGTTFAITALTTTEKLFLIDSTIRISDPVNSLKKFWAHIVSKSDYQIIISHIGDDFSKTIADSFPECDLIVNGHRKSVTTPIDFVGKMPRMEFGFEGKEIATAQLFLASGKLSTGKGAWIEMSDKVAKARSMEDLLAAAMVRGNMQRSSILDLYIMSNCPYGREALVEVIPIVQKFPGLQWNIWFIGTVEADSSLSSMHGKEEVADDILWLAVKELYPRRWAEFLIAQGTSKNDAATVAQALKLDVPRLQAWAKQNGDAALRLDFMRSTRLGINGSPTVVFNNGVLDLQIQSDRIARLLCDEPGIKLPVCESLPACIDDSDCKKPGNIGTCVGKGKKRKCQYVPAGLFRFTAVLDDSMLTNPQESSIATTIDLFPGAVIDTVRAASVRGRQLIQQFDPPTLPLFIFEKRVQQEQNFGRIEPGIVLKNDSYVFKTGIMRNVYFYKRPLIAKKTVLCVDPLFSDMEQILAIVKENSSANVLLWPVFFKSPTDPTLSVEDRARLDEASRWLVVQKYFPNSLSTYIASAAKGKSGSQWIDAIELAGIDLAAFREKQKGDSDLATEHWKLLDILGIAGPVVLFLNNREVVPLRSKADLKKLLEMVRGR